MKIFFAFVIVTVAATAVHAQVDAPRSRWSLALDFGYGAASQTANLPDALTCACSGSDTKFSGGNVFPGAALQWDWNALFGATIHATYFGPTVTSAQTSPPQTVQTNNGAVYVTQTLSDTATIKAICIDLLARIKFDGAYFAAGPTAMLALGSTYASSETISPAGFTFADGSREKIISPAGPIAGLKTFSPYITVGTGYEFILSDKSVIDPEFLATFPVGSMDSEYDWRQVIYRLMLGVSFNL